MVMLKSLVLNAEPKIAHFSRQQSIKTMAKTNKTKLNSLGLWFEESPSSDDFFQLLHLSKLLISLK